MEIGQVNWYTLQALSAFNKSKEKWEKHCQENLTKVKLLDI